LKTTTTVAEVAENSRRFRRHSRHSVLPFSATKGLQCKVYAENGDNYCFRFRPL